MDAINKYINELSNKMNNAPIAGFEGYSPIEMETILYHTFSSRSPVQIIKAEDNVYLDIPLFNQVKFLFELIKEKKELKLTNKGFLPTKVVAELYSKGFLKDYFVEIGFSKVYTESNLAVVHLAKILVELSPFVKKRNNKLSLTKKGLEQIGANPLLFQGLIETFTIQLNWCYFDGYSNERVGQLGFGFTLILFNNYGDQYRTQEFYADKYLEALNFKGDTTDSNFKDDLKQAYIIRTFKRFLDYFGFTEYESNKENPKVKKAKIFNELIKIQK